MAAESFDPLIAIRRRDDVGNERFRAELLNADFSRRGERMAGRNNKYQLVEINHRRSQLRLLRIKGEYAEFDVVLEHIVRNVTAQRTPHRDLDCGMQAAKLAQYRQQVERGEFIGGDREFALL